MCCIRIVFAAFMWGLAAVASAQVLPPPASWTRGTELAVMGGAATASSTTGAALGATAKWDVTRWVSLEGRGLWLDRGTDATAFAADISGLVNLVPMRSVTPFVGAGFGFYRASFDSATATMSDFYRERLTSPVLGGGTNVFTDPALRVTGGVDLMGQGRQRHWTVRPEVSMLLVFANGHSETVLAGTVSVGYWFRGSARGN